MRTVAIVQARMTSTRLPGKVMLALGGQSVLWHVLMRCRAVPGVDAVCCAVPATPESAILAAEAAKCGASVFRGDEFDVLDRYAKAAAHCGAAVVLRVTSDCPLIDPGVCGQVLALRRASAADYACNNMPPSFPHGLDCEAFTAEILHQAAARAAGADEREHVTEWMRRQPGLRRVNLANPRGQQHAMRWTLDYPADYAFLQAVFARLPPVAANGGQTSTPAMPDMDAVMAALAAAPEIAALNRGHTSAAV